MSWLDIFNKLSTFLNKYDPQRTFSFTNRNIEMKFYSMLDRMKLSFVREKLRHEIQVAENWVRIFRRAVVELYKALGLEHRPLYSREFASFLEDIEHHLSKKLVFYAFDLLRNRLSLEEFMQKAGAAVTTSLKTNMRILYQNWVFVSIMRLLGERGARMIYPETKFLLLTRSQQQKLAIIPPNAILATERGYLSFFLEIPRPIAWGDSRDLSRVWKLYTSLRPDICVYGEKLLNALDLSGEIVIKRPDVIIECKELEDWYKRRRDIRGPFAEIMSVEKWRTAWIRGLHEGLSEAVGLIMKSTKKKKKRHKVIYLSDHEIVQLYQKIYKPKIFYLVSRTRIPREIKDNLEENNIEVLDNIMFNHKKLEPLIEGLLNAIRKTHTKMSIAIDEDTYRLLKALSRNIGIPLTNIDNIITILAQFALEHINELQETIRTKANSHKDSAEEVLQKTFLVS